MGNTAEMVQQAKIIARATSSLVHGIKLEAESQNDSESQTKLLAAAKQLADATARMVEAAKAAAANPNDEQCQLALQQVNNLLQIFLIYSEKRIQINFHRTIKVFECSLFLDFIHPDNFVTHR